MTNQTAPGVTERNSLRKTVSLNVPPAAAWRVFTDKMSTVRPFVIAPVVAGLNGLSLSSLVMLATRVATRTAKQAA